MTLTETKPAQTTGPFIFTQRVSALAERECLSHVRPMIEAELWGKAGEAICEALQDGRAREVRTSAVQRYEVGDDRSSYTLHGETVEYQLNVLILLTDERQAEVGEHLTEAALPGGGTYVFETVYTYGAREFRRSVGDSWRRVK